MSKELNEFISVGFTRYKEAHSIYRRFQTEVKGLLFNILLNRENYGALNIKEDSIILRSWADGLMLTARISASVNDVSYLIGIGLDWSASSKELPIPTAWIDDSNLKYVNLNDSFLWSNTRYNKNNQLVFMKEFVYEDLESIFNNLLDEIIEYMDAELTKKEAQLPREIKD